MRSSEMKPVASAQHRQCRYIEKLNRLYLSLSLYASCRTKSRAFETTRVCRNISVKYQCTIHRPCSFHAVLIKTHRCEGIERSTLLRAAAQMLLSSWWALQRVLYPIIMGPIGPQALAMQPTDNDLVERQKLPVQMQFLKLTRTGKVLSLSCQ